ncbi:MAG: hypothetical protein AAB729_05400, partial [Patescibacteria group bacterium]
MIRNGHLYIAQPPLFQVKVGKNAKYAFSDDERDKVLKELIAQVKANKKTKSAKGKDGEEAVEADEVSTVE